MTMATLAKSVTKVRNDVFIKAVDRIEPVFNVPTG
jgi:hypothetical protein